MLLRGEQPTYTVGNLIEFACSDCRRDMGDPGVKLVLHRFDLAGQMVETETIRGDE